MSFDQSINNTTSFAEILCKNTNNDIKNNIIIRSIAREVREWAEHRDQLEPFPTNDLGGMCAIASGRLWRKLTQSGIHATIHLAETIGYAHCYVVVDDYVLDVTATQFAEFRREPIVYIHTKEAEAFDYYNTTKVFNSSKQLREYQKKMRWPVDQTCFE